MKNAIVITLTALVATIPASYTQPALYGSLAMALSAEASVQKVTAQVKTGDKDLGKTSEVDIYGFMDAMRLVDVFAEVDLKPDNEVDLNRDFKEYLVQTMDRETLERKHSEN